MKRLMVLIISVFMCASCEKFAHHKYGIRISNKSKQITSGYGEYIFPDTLLKSEKPLLKEIKPESSILIYDYEVGDEEFKRFKSEKITIFILSKDTLTKYSWNEIRASNNILKRYEITEKDLSDFGGSVIFIP